MCEWTYTEAGSYMKPIHRQNGRQHVSVTYHHVMIYCMAISLLNRTTVHTIAANMQCQWSSLASYCGYDHITHAKWLVTTKRMKAAHYQ